MNNPTRANLDEVQRLLLMAAYYEGARPGSRFQKCGPILRRALGWAGLWDDRVAHAYRADEDNPHIDSYYRTLIAMMRPEPGGVVFVEGEGNLGSPEDPPAAPPYTECRLTLAGAQRAEHLFEDHPEFRA